MRVRCHHVSSPRTIPGTVPLPPSTLSVHDLCLTIFQLLSVLTRPVRPNASLATVSFSWLFFPRAVPVHFTDC